MNKLWEKEISDLDRLNFLHLNNFIRKHNGHRALEKRKQFLFFGILIIGFIGLIAASPTIYAIVEPHITIAMDPGQTTKPFVINDNTGTEVFSVDVDGTISPAVTGANGITALSFFQKDEFQFFAPESNPHIFAIYRLTYDLSGGTGKIDLDINSVIVSGEMKVAPLTGSGAVGTGDLGLNRFTVTNQGSGYAPGAQLPVSITGGGGSGATATAFANNAGFVTGISATNPGSGYTSVPTVTIPPPGAGTQATATARMGVFDLIISNGGSNWNYAPVTTFTGGGSSGAEGVSLITGFQGSVNGFKVVNPGLDYTSPPTAVFEADHSGIANVNVQVVAPPTFDFSFAEFGVADSTYVNVIDKLFETQFFFDNDDFTQNTVDIVFQGNFRGDTDAVTVDVRNMLWKWEMSVPDFVTVQRVV